MKTLLTILLCLFSLVPLQAQNKNYEDAIKLVEVWLDAQRDYEKLPGLTAIAIQDQEVIWMGGVGYANPEKEIKSTSSTIGSICSISKLFTSIAIMKLYEEGKLRLDDKIEDLLPWYDLKQQYAESGPITVRSILTHSSGLPREANYPYWTGPDFPFPSTDMVKMGLKEQTTLYPSSTYFQYSNLGLTLLGEIISEVSGMSYDDYIQQTIIEPLKLDNTRTTLPENLYGNQLAVGYSALNRQLERNKVELFQANGIKAAAGFSSTVEDLGKMARWNLRLLDTTTTEILKPSTIRYMQNVHWVDPDFGVQWGLGYAVSKGDDGTKWVGHGGSCPGYRSSFVMNPSTKWAYAVIINASGTNPGQYVQGMHELFKKITSTTDSSSSKDFSDYIGYYNAMPWNSESYIGQLNGELVSLSLPTSDPAEALTRYRHIEGDTFRRIRDNKELGEEIIFERNEQGEVIRAQSHGNYRSKIR